ncbi:two-component system sensor histidine kinase CreC [Entomomonas sp. E2T0]|uniref:two-component system sensor histidine kinase CreC n=1 Tax=Entomomonas sp. E2T0 TaxID=2930213 RepID=UPI0022282A60|nr:two-component system sensor histidine kinase CreC [Entomomonas sp. E2T0]UYZ85025.1 two-component system sensor histidine kinase CreC [Entomomonas sp. E2T0]
MALAKRIFLFYFLFVALCGYFMVNLFSNQIYPSIRQTTEETLVDTANLLAEIVSDDLQQGKINQYYLQHRLAAYQKRDPNASIWGIAKNSVAMRIYITNDKGIVLFDSTGKEVGKDYSRWRDVYLTLHGAYGARTTQENPKDDKSTIMYVAAPIKYENKIIGVLTVGKPNITVSPYINKAESRLIFFGVILLIASLAVGALLSWWLGASLHRFTLYANAISKGERIKAPQFYGGELTQLAKALDKMRGELDGKNYVERYVHTLTHELKSPLAAIRGATELLQQDMPIEKRTLFLKNIDSESERLQKLADRLLNLSMVEQRQTLEEINTIPILPLIQKLLASKSSRIAQQQLNVEVNIDEQLTLQGEVFLLEQALSNILDNALDFIADQGLLKINSKITNQQLAINFYNQGASIPDYALNRLCERFYSLARPKTGRKSTGLGLNFVQEVVLLHKGQLSITNYQEGVLVTLSFPIAISI